eukprot:scaffold64335_cov65-Phaeocystis_antarctica.AAC.5
MSRSCAVEASRCVSSESHASKSVTNESTRAQSRVQYLHWAMGIGRWALGIGHWTLGIEHWALGIGHMMIVAVDERGEPVSSAAACSASAMTERRSVSGERRSSLSSKWCEVPRSVGSSEGTMEGTSSARLAWRCSPGSKSAASRSCCSLGAWSEWMRSSLAKNETTSGTRAIARRRAGRAHARSGPSKQSWVGQPCGARRPPSRAGAERRRSMGRTCNRSAPLGAAADRPTSSNEKSVRRFRGALHRLKLQPSILLGKFLSRREGLDVLVKEELAVKGNVAVALKLREVLDEQLSVAHQVALLRAVILRKSAWRT